MDGQNGHSAGVSAAIARLEERLPLRARQAALPPPLAALHRAILWSLVREGEAPSSRTMAGLLGGVPPGEALARLGRDDLVVLDPEDGSVAGAYPLTTEDTPHRLQVGACSVRAMCALDALSVAPVFGVEVCIESGCAVTGDPVRVEQQGTAVADVHPNGLRVGVRWQHPEGCAAHSMCRDMVFLRDADVAEAWRAGGDAGLFSLEEGVAFASGFFRPLLGAGDAQGTG